MKVINLAAFLWTKVNIEMKSVGKLELFKWERRYQLNFLNFQIVKRYKVYLLK